MEKMAEEVGEIPVELERRLVAFDESLSEAEEILQNLQKVSFGEIQSQLSSLDKAKLDLVGAYVMNSLFWMYLGVHGENPKEHGVKQELDRIRTYMSRVKEIQDKEKAPKLDVDASKRFLRNALWDAAHKGPAQSAIKRKSNNEEVVMSSANDATLPHAASVNVTSFRADSGSEQPSLKKQKKKKRKDKLTVD
jgi:exosome complex protein LRP1